MLTLPKCWPRRSLGIARGKTYLHPITRPDHCAPSPEALLLASSAMKRASDRALTAVWSKALTSFSLVRNRNRQVPGLEMMEVAHGEQQAEYRKMTGDEMARCVRPRRQAAHFTCADEAPAALDPF